MPTRVPTYIGLGLILVAGAALLGLCGGLRTGPWLARYALLHPMLVAGRLLLALGLVAMIGIEREVRDKPAGVRTTALVGVGACLFALIAERLSTDGEAVARVIQGVVTGVGFLGAGTIIKEQFQIEGLTTAAAVWAAAGLGLACGLGFYHIAVVGTATVFLVLMGLRLLERPLRHIHKSER